MPSEAPPRTDRARIWAAAALTGLFTSTFSTLVVVFTATRIGRDVALSWMEVATVLLRDSAVRLEPTAREIAAGIAVHQFADFSWAVLFFGLGARWTWRIQPVALLVAAPLWAAATEVAEYWLILPWLQPLLIMQTPFWVGYVTHLASATAYPVFFLLRERLLGRPLGGAAFARRWLAGLGGLLAVLALLSALGETGREVPWPGGSAAARDYDQRFMRHMAAHHDVGVRLAQLAAEKSERHDLRVLCRLMVAEQRAEIEVLQRWWHSWVGGGLPPLPGHEHDAIPGMPPPGAVEALARLEGAAFEQRFLALMIPHHLGAIQMAEDAMRRARDPRLRLLADQIRHPQGGQVSRMMALQRAAAGR